MRPHLSASCTKTAAAAVVAWRGGRAPPGPRRPSPPQRPLQRPAPRPSRARPSRVALSKGSVGVARVCCAWVPPLEDGACSDKQILAPVLRGAQHVLRHVPRHVLRDVLCRVLHMLVNHVSPKGKRGRRHACVGLGPRRWKTTMGKISTFMLPSSAAPSTSSAASRHVLRHVLRRVLCVLVNHASPKGRRRGGRHACVGRLFHRWKVTMHKTKIFTPPSFVTPNTSSATSCAKSVTCDVHFFGGKINGHFSSHRHTHRHTDRQRRL